MINEKLVQITQNCKWVQEKINEYDEKWNMSRTYDHEVFFCYESNIIQYAAHDIKTKDCVLHTNTIELLTEGTKEEILTLLIDSIYKQEINARNRIVKDAKNYYTRKIKSLCLHTERGNTKKIQQINEDLIAKYKIVNNLKEDLEFYKGFVRNLYRVKNFEFREVI